MISCTGADPSTPGSSGPPPLYRSVREELGDTCEVTEIDERRVPVHDVLDRVPGLGHEPHVTVHVMPIGVTRVFHLNVNCSDLERSLRFYRDLLGLTEGAHTVSPEQDGSAFGLETAAWDALDPARRAGLRRRGPGPARVADPAPDGHRRRRPRTISASVASASARPISTRCTSGSSTPACRASAHRTTCTSPAYRRSGP